MFYDQISFLVQHWLARQGELYGGCMEGHLIFLVTGNLIIITIYRHSERTTFGMGTSV